MNGYNCNCFVGYTGTYCNQQISYCASGPCQNGGICVNGQPLPNMYKCMCTTGYYGYNCELTNNPCGSNPCGLHGSCSAINFNQDFV